MSSVKRKIPPEKWTLVTKVLMRKVLLLWAGVGHGKPEEYKTLSTTKNKI